MRDSHAVSCAQDEFKFILWESKMTAQREIALAQGAMLSGKMGACGMHLSKAMHADMAK